MPPTQPHIGQFFIQVHGADLPLEVMDHLDEAVVEDDLAQPAMFALRFHDPQFTLLDGEQFELGREVTLSAANAAGHRTPIMTGEITALEPELEQHDPALVVRGYDRGHRLHRGRKTRTFLKQTDSDIVAAIAREANLRTDIEPSSERYEYVIQNNQTDMEFLRMRALRIGYGVTVHGQTLRFRRVEAAPPQVPAQEWGVSLSSLRVRLSAAAQPNEIQVRGWDHQAKRALVGKASAPTQTGHVGDGANGGVVAQQSFGAAATVCVTDRPVSTQSEADHMAQAVLDELAGDYLQAEGTCQGEPTLRAGTQVEVKGVGRRLHGTYFVTATRHEYTPDGGYTTTFTVNGRRPRSLLAALDSSPQHHTVEGVVIGIVTNINDLRGWGRIKVKFPWLDDGQESDWIRIAAPGAGKERGLCVLPEVDDEVLLAFEHGDIGKPYVIGGLWNGKDPLPAAVVDGGKVRTRMLKTRAGHMIEIEDDTSAGQGFIQLTTNGGHVLKISDNDRLIEIKSQTHTLTLDDQARAVRVESGGDLEMKGLGGKLSITAQGVELVSNTNLNVQAKAMLDVKTSAVLSIQGSLVKINS